MNRVSERFQEELDRVGVRSASEAARLFGQDQQWLSRRLTGTTDWKVTELTAICEKLGLSYTYVAVGIRDNTPTTGELLKEFANYLASRQEAGDPKAERVDLARDTEAPASKARGGDAAAITERVPRPADARQGGQD